MQSSSRLTSSRDALNPTRRNRDTQIPRRRFIRRDAHRHEKTNLIYSTSGPPHAPRVSIRPLLGQSRLAEIQKGLSLANCLIERGRSPRLQMIEERRTLRRVRPETDWAISIEFSLLLSSSSRRCSPVFFFLFQRGRTTN